MRNRKWAVATFASQTQRSSNSERRIVPWFSTHKTAELEAVRRPKTAQTCHAPMCVVRLCFLMPRSMNVKKFVLSFSKSVEKYDVRLSWGDFLMCCKVSLSVAVHASSSDGGCP